MSSSPYRVTPPCSTPARPPRQGDGRERRLEPQEQRIVGLPRPQSRAGPSQPGPRRQPQTAQRAAPGGTGRAAGPEDAPRTSASHAALTAESVSVTRRGVPPGRGRTPSRRRPGEAARSRGPPASARARPVPSRTRSAPREGGVHREGRAGPRPEVGAPRSGGQRGRHLRKGGVVLPQDEAVEIVAGDEPAVVGDEEQGQLHGPPDRRWRRRRPRARRGRAGRRGRCRVEAQSRRIEPQEAGPVRAGRGVDLETSGGEWRRHPDVDAIGPSPRRQPGRCTNQHP